MQWYLAFNANVGHVSLDDVVPKTKAQIDLNPFKLIVEKSDVHR